MVPTLKWYLTKLIYTYTRTDIVSRPGLCRTGRIDFEQIAIAPKFFLELRSIQKQPFHRAPYQNITLANSCLPQASGLVQWQLLARMLFKRQRLLTRTDVRIIRCIITDIIFNLHVYIDNNDGFHLLKGTPSVSVISLSRESLSFVSRGLSYVTGVRNRDCKWDKMSQNRRITR